MAWMASRESRFPPLGHTARIERLQLPRKLANRGFILPAASATGNEDLREIQERMGRKQTPLICTAITVWADSAVDAELLSRNRMEESCNTHNSLERLAHQVDADSSHSRLQSAPNMDNTVKQAELAEVDLLQSRGSHRITVQVK